MEQSYSLVGVHIQNDAFQIEEELSSSVTRQEIIQAVIKPRLELGFSRSEESLHLFVL